ncbi:hypothetical protein PRNP1_003856 [Phytophthora ramorum]
MCNALLVAAVGLLVDTAAASTDVGQAELPKTINNDAVGTSHKRHLRSEFAEDLIEWPERIEEYIEHHTRVREIFRAWCMEGKEPKDAMEEAEDGTPEKATAVLYKKFLAEKGESGRKLTIVECDV